MKIIANLDKISKVEVRYQKKSSQYEYKPTKWGIFNLFSPGLYDLHNITPTREIHVPKHIKIENDIAYDKPYVVIRFTNHDYDKIKFDTDKEVDDFLEQIKGLKTITYKG